MRLGSSEEENSRVKVPGQDQIKGFWCQGPDGGDVGNRVMPDWLVRGSTVREYANRVESQAEDQNEWLESSLPP